MANLAATTITGALNVTSTITGPASGASALNASNVSSGTLGTARLPTVPTSKGGTGLTSIGTAGQVLTVANPGSALEFAAAGGAAGGNQLVYTSPATYNPPADLHSVKITCVGAGGRGGNGQTGGSGGGGGAGGYAIDYIPAASIPGPVSVTAGAGASGTASSFGAFVNANAGQNGQDNNPSIPLGSKGANGNASGGQLNASGYEPGIYYNLDDVSINKQQMGDSHALHGGGGGNGPSPNNNGSPGGTFGAGGGGGRNNSGSGGSGGDGYVIVEELYG
jgi:hypothetical protein